MAKETVQGLRTGLDNAAAHSATSGPQSQHPVVNLGRLTTRSFRLHDLPQEIRDMIYDYSLEPKAIFRHTNDMHLEFPDPGHNKPDTDNNKQEWFDTFDQLHPPEVDEEETPAELYHVSRNDPNGRFSGRYRFPKIMLTYKIFSMSTPLLLVSKELRIEAKRILEANTQEWINHYNEVAHSNVYYHRIVNPSKAFQYLWSCSELLLENSSRNTIFFLQTLPKVLRESLSRLSITSRLVIERNPLSISYWPGDEGDGQVRRAFLARLLQKHYPSLRTVGLEMPCETYSEATIDDSAVQLFCFMLESGKLDTIRYFYTLGYPRSLLEALFSMDVAFKGFGIGMRRENISLQFTSGKLQQNAPILVRPKLARMIEVHFGLEDHHDVGEQIEGLEPLHHPLVAVHEPVSSTSDTFGA